MTIVLETQRLLLRPLAAADMDALYTLYKQYELMRYITGQPRSYAKTKERLRAHMAEHEQYGFGLYATILKETGVMIGRCGLEPVNRATGLEGNMAWMFQKAYWGQGLATEFGQAMLPYGFDRLHLRRIFATADHRNIASIRVMQKLGMRLIRSDDFEVEYEAYPGHQP